MITGQSQSLKEEVNKNAFKTLENNLLGTKSTESKPTQRTEGKFCFLIQITLLIN